MNQKYINWSNKRYTKANGSFLLIHPNMFEAETDSEEEKKYNTSRCIRIQFVFKNKIPQRLVNKIKIFISPQS